ncbi:MAG TPA: lipid-A-disaccharide synthase [bacterium]|nr:lipid-A-disaccharide synthase [bacterium]
MAGEVSGDHQGALLTAALRRQRPALAISGVGGAEMRAAGVDVLVESLRWGVIGYLEAYARLPIFAARFWRLVRLIERGRPDLLILVDFPGINRELVRHFSGRMPMVYYFPPQTYGRRGRSAERMARAAVRLLAVFPFEAEAYRRAGADVVCVGHPAVDEAAQAAASSPALRAEWGLGAEPLVGLLPGSRAQEIRGYLPPMLDAARGLRASLPVRFVLPIASPFLEPAIRRLVERAGVPVRLVGGRALDAMRVSDTIVVAAGTAAVEAACVGTPMVAVGRVSPLTYWIARRWVLTPEFDRLGFAVPNAVMDRRIIPELGQHDVTGPRIHVEVERLLADAASRERMRHDLAEVRRRLGPPGVLDRAAREALRVLDSPGPGTLR